MSRRTWLFVGAGFGFTVPFLLNVFQHLGPWNVRPCAYFLFGPGLIVLRPVDELLHRNFDSIVFLGVLISVVNAAVFGAVAYSLRRWFLLLLAVLLVINYVSLPPSDTKLEKRLIAERPNFERLIQKASQTPSIVKIGMKEIEDTEGRKYREGEKQDFLSPESWNDYREIFKKIGLKEGLYRSPRTGQMQFLSHTIFGKIGPIGTIYGYVYCPAASNTLHTGLLPCSEQREEYDIVDYRYKRIAPEWFVVEIFQTHSLIN
jgi:hypothetical protein